MSAALSDFCGSTFWDLNVTWYTNDPDFTPCFEQTVLVWIPCGFLWCFFVLDVYYSVSSRSRSILWSLLGVAKYIITVLLIVAEAVKIGISVRRNSNGFDVYPVDFYTPAIKIVTFILYIGLLHLSRKRGVLSSGVHFIFWLLLGLCETITLRTIIQGDYYDYESEKAAYLAHLISYPVLVCQVLVNCWAEKQYVKEKPYYNATKSTCPEHESSFLNRIIFSWFDELAWKGFRKPLDFPDLWTLNPEDTSRRIVPLFDKNWSKNLSRGENQREPNGNQKKNVSIFVPLFKSFGSNFLFGSFLRLIADLMAFVSPQILNLLLDFVKSEEPTWKGILYAAIMFCSAFLQTLLVAQATHRMYQTGIRTKTALISAVYRKSLLISSAARRDSAVGEILNLMSVDVHRIMDLIPMLYLLWSGPIQIAVALYFLWGILGPSALAGLGVMIVLIPINSLIAAKTRKLQLTQMKYKDHRVKLMNETLSGVKVLKLYAWEPSFGKQIVGIRAQEMRALRTSAVLNGISNFLSTCAPFLVTLATFTTYVLSDPSHILDPQKSFVSISLFNVINAPLSFLPLIIVMLTQAMVSFKRLNRYINMDEIDPDAVSHDNNRVEPIVMENGTFSWCDDVKVLRNIHFKVREGELVAVVGSVGSGKSSLLSALLGEMKKHNGSVNMRGSVAYVPQQAWIQNATLKDNILFGCINDPAKYEKVISACALKPDLEMLPGGDQTEIGEKGINLSGGQKQRVSVARATYNNANVYLFDDPLSAVDSHVGKHIFERVLGPRGLLRRKTRVLVTHGISFLPQCDSIIVMKDGQISEMGTYRELLDRKGGFAEFLMQHLTETEALEEIDDATILKDIENVVGSLDEIRSRRKKSSTTPSVTSTINGSFSEIQNQYRKYSTISSFSVASVGSTYSRANMVVEKKTMLIQAEKKETTSVKMSIYRDYFRAAGLVTVCTTFFLYLFSQGFSVGANLWLSSWTDQEIVNGTADTSERNVFLGVYGAFGACQGMSILFGTMFLLLGTLKSAEVFHSRMLNRILQAPMSFFDTTPVGRVVNRFSKDLDVADNTLPLFIRYWLNYFFQVVATIIVISYSTPIFIAVIIPVAGLYYFVQKVFVSTSRQVKRLESVTRSPIYSHFDETLAGAPMIRAYRDQERFILDSEKKCDTNQESYFPAVVANRWLQVRLETTGNTVIFFAALFAVLGRESLNPGIVGLSVSYALQITVALNMLVRWTSDVETNLVSIERLQEYVEAPQEAPWQIPDKKPPKEWPEQGVIEFKDFQVRYREGLDLVLRGISCQIQSGEKIGIVGRTGAGKSSLTLALFRIIEAAGGSIKIDGRDISALGLHDVRGRLTIIPQDPVLFSGTLRDNLDPFNRYSDEAIWKALTLSHLSSYVSGLSAGLEHEIAEGGANLSIGQRQLICLARALLRKTKVLVLDEATAAVDLETDDMIQETIRREFRDSTVITIAHRLNTIMDSTRVMVLDRGEIREFDSPANLLSSKTSVFYDMAKDAGLV